MVGGREGAGGFAEGAFFLFGTRGEKKEEEDEREE